MAGKPQHVDDAMKVLRQVEGETESVPAPTLTAAIAACGHLRSWVAAVEAACLGEVRRRKGDPSAVAASQGTSRRAAAAAVRRSKTINRLPEIGEALAFGSITSDHVDAFGSVRSDHAEALGDDIGELLTQATEVDADQFRQGLRQWQLERDRANGDSELDRQRKNRKGSVSTRAEDGMGIFRFELDAIAAERVSAALAKKSEQLWRADHDTARSDSQTSGDSTRRTPAQRMADAFEQLTCGGRSPGSASMVEPNAGMAVDTTIMIIADIDALRAGLGGRAELLDGTPLPVDELRKLALSARLLPAIFDTNGQPLWLGRSARLPNAAQRAAIAARDRGCSIPGCDVPIGWCQIHHILWWSRGGATDLDNLTTVCSKHHHMIHDDGWQVSRSPAGTVGWRGPP